MNAKGAARGGNGCEHCGSRWHASASCPTMKRKKHVGLAGVHYLNEHLTAIHEGTPCTPHLCTHHHVMPVPAPIVKDVADAYLQPSHNFQRSQISARDQAIKMALENSFTRGRVPHSSSSNADSDSACSSDNGTEYSGGSTTSTPRQKTLFANNKQNHQICDFGPHGGQVKDFQ